MRLGLTCAFRCLRRGGALFAKTMGHSARAKFKREIRVQRTSIVTETERDKDRQTSVQLALARAAAAPKVTLKNFRGASSSEGTGNSSEAVYDEEIVNAAKAARQTSIESAKWGLTATATVLKTKGGNVSKKRLDKGLSARQRAVASFKNDSKQQKRQKAKMKAVLSGRRR